MIGALNQAVAGIAAGFERLESAAQVTAQDGANADLDATVVATIEAQAEVAANVAVVRATSDTIGTLLDVLA